MYRIEVRPGEETVFRTIDELATGIRNGFITSRARIYHAASQKWLPIEFHPHYKKALDGNFTPTAATPQPSLAGMPAPTFSFSGATPAPQPAPGPEPAMVPAPEPPEAPASVSPADPSPPVAAPPSVAAKAASAPLPREEPWRRTTGATVAESPVMAMHAAVRRPESSETDAEPGPIERYSPVALVDRPRAAPAPSPVAEVVLPNITYPELPPMEQAEHRATARRSRRTAGRPLLLVGSAAVLVLAGQRFLASLRAASRGPEPVAEAAASEPASPEASRGAPSRPGAKADPAARWAATRASARAPSRPQPLVPPPAQPMTPGPAFAASVPTRLAPASAAPGSAPLPVAEAPVVAARAPARQDSATIAPVPTAIELDVPALLPGESIAPSLDESRDSLAMKRILKAVTGRKANPTAP